MNLRAPVLALVVLTTGCPDGSSTSPTTTTATEQIATTRPSERAVSEWLDRAASAPHNGSNPELELPPTLVRDGADAFQRAIRGTVEGRRHDAASALARHPEPATQRAFWLTQLATPDATVRLYALTTIATIHAPEDFEPFVRACLTTGDWNTLGVRVRDWGDRRAVPVLAELLGRGDLAAANAASSLPTLPGVPTLPAEQVDPSATATHLPNGAWRDPETSLVPPYTRWWAGEGRTAFATECAWWLTIHTTGTACRAP